MDVMKKVPVREQDPKVRATNFEEVCYGYNEEEAVAEAERCLNCKNARCVEGCPVNIDIPTFIREVKERKFEDAANTIALSSALPAVCGRVCPQETQCEKHCVRAIKGEAVGIGRLERFVADWHRAQQEPKAPSRAEEKGKKVAVVGGGNSAVSEALLLSRLCRHVTLVHRRSTFRASAAELAALEKQDNVTFCRNSIVTELLGRERLTGIRLQNGRELEISGLFVCIGRTPVSALGGEQLRRTPDGYYCADETTRTGLPGVFAAGDVREKQLRQIVTAVSDGAAAAQQAEHYLGKTSRRAEI